MLYKFTGSGKTIEEARVAAINGLKAQLLSANIAFEEEDIHCTILQQPEKKFLGLFGGKDAQMEASYDDGRSEKKPAPKKAPKQNRQKQAAKKDAPKKVAPKKAEPKAAPKAEPKNEPVKKEVKEESKKDFPESVNLEYAKAYLGAIIKGLKIEDAKIDASYDSGVVTLDIECDDFGIIIGKHGDTLDSIQYLLSLAMKKNSNGYVRVVINVGNYREKRHDIIKHLATKNASYVLRTGRRYTFEPMNPYERRIVHTTIQEIEGVESRSIGYNQDRRVVIEPVGGVKARSNSGGYRRNNSRNNKTESPVAPSRAPKADRTDIPKFGKIEINKD